VGPADRDRGCAAGNGIVLGSPVSLLRHRHASETAAVLGRPTPGNGEDVSSPNCSGATAPGLGQTDSTAGDQAGNGSLRRQRKRVRRWLFPRCRRSGPEVRPPTPGHARGLHFHLRRRRPHRKGHRPRWFRQLLRRGSNHGTSAPSSRCGRAAGPTGAWRGGGWHPSLVVLDSDGAIYASGAQAGRSPSPGGARRRSGAGLDRDSQRHGSGLRARPVAGGDSLYMGGEFTGTLTLSDGTTSHAIPSAGSNDGVLVRRTPAPGTGGSTSVHAAASGR